jgi:TolA-binding protein
MSRHLLLLAALPLLFLAGCGNGNDYSAERQAFQDRLESQIAEFNQQIQELRERSTETPGENQGQRDEAILELERQVEELESRLEEVRGADGDGWEGIKSRAEEAATEAEKSFQQFREKFGAALPNSG